MANIKDWSNALTSIFPREEESSKISAAPLTGNKVDWANNIIPVSPPNPNVGMSINPYGNSSITQPAKPLAVAPQQKTVAKTTTPTTPSASSYQAPIAPDGYYFAADGRLTKNGTGQGTSPAVPETPEVPVNTTDNPREAAPAYIAPEAPVIDEAAIRKQEAEALAAQLAAIENIYAGEIAKARKAGNARVGQRTAMSTVRGGAGSDFAAAEKDTIEMANQDIENAIIAEREAKKGLATSENKDYWRQVMKDAQDNLAKKKELSDAYLASEKSKFSDAENKARTLAQAGSKYDDLDATTRSLLEYQYGGVENAVKQFEQLAQKALEKPQTIGSADTGYYQYNADGTWKEIIPPSGGNNTTFKNINGREVMITYDKSGKIINQTDLGVSGSGSGSGTKKDPAQEMWEKDVQEAILELAENAQSDEEGNEQGSYVWGNVWNRLYAKYRNAGIQPEQLDNALNKEKYFPVTSK